MKEELNFSKRKKEKLRQDLQQKNDSMVLKLRSSLAKAVDSKTSTELETSRALRKTLERVKRLVKKSRNHYLSLNFKKYIFSFPFPFSALRRAFYLFDLFRLATVYYQTIHAMH